MEHFVRYCQSVFIVDACASHETTHIMDFTQKMRQICRFRQTFESKKAFRFKGALPHTLPLDPAEPPGPHYKLPPKPLPKQNPV